VLRLVRRIDAETSHARLQMLDGRPGYFTSPAELARREKRKREG
jgi:hypothetical protein